MYLCRNLDEWCLLKIRNIDKNNFKIEKNNQKSYHKYFYFLISTNRCYNYNKHFLPNVFQLSRIR